jgi:MoaA/NifB/PqqE/SkfB family radical SAM enzyme
MTIKTAARKIMKALLPYGIVWLYNRYVNKSSLRQKKRERLKQQKTLQRVEVYIVNHCNLKCAGCGVFSPLAREEYLDIACYEQDCRRLAELTNGEVKLIRLLGGEPTLHPKLLEFCKTTRECFKNSKIQLVTNGILLAKKEDDFWEICKKNNIVIQISEYPISINITGIMEKASSHEVVIEFTGTKTDTMWHMKLNMEGTEDTESSFKNCWLGNNCVTLSDGKLYTCSVIPAIGHFNKYFNKDLRVQEDDYIDIYKAETIKEVLEFLCKPAPFCRYCDMAGMTYGHKWRISKKDIKEWS